MANNKEQSGWIRGYPSKEMIKANESKLWLVKTKDGAIETLKIPPSLSLDLLLKEEYCFCKDKKHIIIKGKDGYYDDTNCDEQFEFASHNRILLIWETGYFEVIYEEDGRFENAEKRISVKGRIDLKTFLITDTFTDTEADEYNLYIVDEILQEIPIVIKLFHETDKLQKNIKQKDKQWGNTYFCPIDNDGNKITVIPGEE